MGNVVLETGATRCSDRKITYNELAVLKHFLALIFIQFIDVFSVEYMETGLKQFFVASFMLKHNYKHV